ncbi:phosphatase PAP2 family protein [Gleimia coleocanis]|uniref:phosphatase PAP2 family protein n=1 Tax=Gleimia coleocanis TaxID=103618 RepID=UPI0003062DE7|nr:phosphatase PAP2 family protein [Gleimia coleocanis]
MRKERVSLPESAIQRQREQVVKNQGLKEKSGLQLGPADWRRPVRVGAFGVFLLLFIISTFFSLFTATGQALDQLVLDMAMLSFPGARFFAWPVARSISLWGIAAVTLVAALWAVAKRRWELGLRIAIFVLGANLTTQVLKNWLLGRPYLGVGFELPNSLPSGHTTVAMCAVLAIVVVAPQRVRVPVAIAGALLAASVAVSVVLLGWHRPSDVVSAILVVLLWALVLVPHERPQGFSQGLNLRLLFLNLGLLSAFLLGCAAFSSRLQSVITQMISSPRAPGKVTAAGTPLEVFTMFPGVTFWFAVFSLAAIVSLVGFVVHFVVLLESGRTNK